MRALGAYVGLVAHLGKWLDGALPGRALICALAAGAGAWWVRRHPGSAVAGGLAGLAIGLLLPSGRSPPPAPRSLRVTFLDVGQGEATLIEAPGLRALVDTGPPSAKVERILRRRGITSLDAVLLSHDQLDHDGRTAAILRSLRVALLITPALPGAGASLREALAAARDRRTRVLTGRAGLVFRRGGVELRIVGPQHATGASSANDAALIVQARQGDCTFLLPADAESPVLLEDRLAPVGVLEVSHHGSGDDTLDRLLARLRPRLAVISVGARNRYGHPSPATLATLASSARAGPSHRSRGRHLARVRRRPGDPGTILAMSAAPLDPVYLIGGTDRPKVELAIRRLRARVRAEDGSIEEFTARRHDDDGEGIDGEEAADSCNALGLFGGTRLLVVGGRGGLGRRQEGARRPRRARRLPPRHPRPTPCSPS